MPKTHQHPTTLFFWSYVPKSATKVDYSFRYRPSAGRTDGKGDFSHSLSPELGFEESRGYKVTAAVRVPMRPVVLYCTALRKFTDSRTIIFLLLIVAICNESRSSCAHITLYTYIYYTYIYGFIHIRYIYEYINIHILWIYTYIYSKNHKGVFAVSRELAV